MESRPLEIWLMVSLPCEGSGIYIMTLKAVGLFFFLPQFWVKLKLRAWEILLKHADSLGKVWNHELSEGATWWITIFIFPEICTLTPTNRQRAFFCVSKGIMCLQQSTRHWTCLRISGQACCLASSLETINHVITLLIHVFILLTDEVGVSSDWKEL